ncbi:MAG TPA: hypothetical protein VJ939_00670, partial [Bacteroidales bacterium]|nr:hypothetical protein [Bacteroidales bacterium]
DDKIVCFFGGKYYNLHGYDLTTHFEENADKIEKFNPKKVYSVVYYNGEKENYFVKRFSLEPSEKPQHFLDDHKKTRVVYFTDEKCPRVELEFDNSNRKKERENEEINLAEFIDVKSFKAMGNRLSKFDIKKVKVLEPLTCEEDDEQSNDNQEEPIENNIDPEGNQEDDDQGLDQMELNLD